MVARIPFAQTALAVLLTWAQPSVQKTFVTPMFILDSAPLSLDASVVAMTPMPTLTYQSIVTYSVDCPQSATPDNDACRALSIYPAEVWYTQGSLWGGTTTARADDTTTVWMCDLGSSVGGGTTGGPFCVKSIAAAGAAARVETTFLNSCYIQAHSVPLVVTAGAEKLPHPYYTTYGVSQLHSYDSSRLSSMGCMVSSTMAMTSTALTTPTRDGASATGGTIQPTATQSQVSDTAAGSSSPSATSKSESSDLWLGTAFKMPVLATRAEIMGI
ncbi:hypothetical protein V492_01064 [Pseudogymnoascus sp. VKM F-4246]|nr:hypothetical protein V492_01064 [Pseudogymnoascus sp. VKM F-4246]